MKYTFTIFKKIEGTNASYKPTLVEIVAPSLPEAIEALTRDYPENNIAPHLRGLWKEENE